MRDMLKSLLLKIGAPKDPRSRAQIEGAGRFVNRLGMRRDSWGGSLRVGNLSAGASFTRQDPLDPQRGGKMLRTLFLLIALVILIAVALVWTGVVSLRQDGNGVSVETRDIEVRSDAVNITVPVIATENRQVTVPSVGLSDDEPANAQ
jgi:hypothetical protein